MSAFRAPGGASRRVLALVLILSCLSFPAEAARRRAQPVITKAPKLVHYGDKVRIVGEVRHGRRGMKVYLKRRHVGYGRKLIRVKRLPRDRKVKFFLHNRTKSADYRLVLHPGKPNKRVSGAVRVRVAPRFTFRVDPNDVKTRRDVDLSGQLLPEVPGRTARVEIRDEGKWKLLEKVDVGDGKYARSFEPKVRGRREMRVIFPGDTLNTRARRKERLWIYRRGEATWYGPGLYGNTTACGQTLRRKTLGVAHRTLPCGTKVDFLYKGRTITVRVIDRGPYGEADWDLTSRTKERLHFEGRGIVGFIAH